jgi:hypothetical protein
MSVQSSAANSSAVAAASSARSAYINIALMAGMQALAALTQPGPKRPGKDNIKVNYADAAQVWSYIAGTVKMFPHLIWFGDYSNKKVKNADAIENIAIQSGLGGLGGYVAGGGTFGIAPTPPSALIGLAEGAALGGIAAGIGQLRTASYKHFAGFAYGICHGPIDGIRTIWIDEKEAYSGSTSNAGNTITIDKPKMWGGDHEMGGLHAVCDIVRGDFWPTQLVNTYLASQVPDAPAFSGKALFIWCGQSRATGSGYFAATPADSPLVRPIALEVCRFPSNLSVPAFKQCGSDSLDANPAEVAYEWITNRVYGGKLAASRIDLASFQDGAETHFNEGLGMSLELNREYDVESALDDISSMADVAIHGSLQAGTIKYKPIRRTYSIASLLVLRHGNDATVTDKSDFNVLEIESHELGTWKGTVNDIRLEYQNRLNKYQIEKQPAFDTANRIIQGRQVTSNKQFRGVGHPSTAALVATREMRAACYPRPPFVVYINRDAAWDADEGRYIEPGDVRKLISNKLGWTKIVRILEVGIGKEDDSRVRLSCVEDVFGVGAAAFADSGSGGFTYPLDPAEITEYVVQDAPYFLSRDDDPKVLVFAAKPNNAQVKYDVKVSTDLGSTYTEESPDADFAIVGTITEAVERLTDVKLTSLTFTPANPLEADRLESASTSEIATGENLIYWPDTGEWGAVEEATDNGDGTFTLGNVWRAVGGFDSVPAPHDAGATVWFFTYGKGLSAEHVAASDLRLKLISNALGSDLDEADADAISHTTTTRPLKPIPVRGVTISGSYSLTVIGASDDVVVAWNETNRLTEGIVKLQDDDGVEPEDSTTYTVRWYATEAGGSVLLRTESGIAASTGTQTATLTAVEEAASGGYLGHLSLRYRIEIDVVRDGQTSETYIREVIRPVPIPSATVAITVIEPTVSTSVAPSAPIVSVGVTVVEPTVSGSVAPSVPIVSIGITVIAPDVSLTAPAVGGVLAAEVFDWQKEESNSEVGSSIDVLEIEVFE